MYTVEHKQTILLLLHKYSSIKMTCIFCNKDYSNLKNHLINMHGIEERDYDPKAVKRFMFSILPKYVSPNDRNAVIDSLGNSAENTTLPNRILKILVGIAKQPITSSSIRRNRNGKIDKCHKIKQQEYLKTITYSINDRNAIIDYLGSCVDKTIPDGLLRMIIKIAKQPACIKRKRVKNLKRINTNSANSAGDDYGVRKKIKKGKSFKRSTIDCNNTKCRQLTKDGGTNSRQKE